MARYSVVIGDKAELEFLAIPFPARRQLNQLIYKLKDDPHPTGSSLVDGTLHKIAAHGWMMAYEVDDDALTITIGTFQKSTVPSA